MDARTYLKLRGDLDSVLEISTAFEIPNIANDIYHHQRGEDLDNQEQPMSEHCGSHVPLCHLAPINKRSSRIVIRNEAHEQSRWGIGVGHQICLAGLGFTRPTYLCPRKKGQVGKVQRQLTIVKDMYDGIS